MAHKKQKPQQTTPAKPTKATNPPKASKPVPSAKPAKRAKQAPLAAAPEGHTRVVVPFDHHWKDVDAEVLWAVPVGESRFAIRNVPFYAYGLNWGDVVRAVAYDGDEDPVVERVESESGHQTVRVFMDDEVAETKSVGMLESLERFNATYERHSGGFIAIDIPPDGDFDGVFDQLEAWEAEGLLGFETCESRVKDGFGSDPAADDGDFGDE